MIPEPLHGKPDAKSPRKSIAGHLFDPLNGKCSCGKVYSDISCAPESAISDDRQAGLWCHQGALTRHEWQQIQDENSRIMECCRS
jgi:hypothetical protein